MINLNILPGIVMFIFSLFLIAGKGKRILGGYRSASQKPYDWKRLCRFLGSTYLGLSVIAIASGFNVVSQLPFFWVTFRSLVIVVLIFSYVVVNKTNKFKITTAVEFENTTTSIH